jgi:hypothetical protein
VRLVVKIAGRSGESALVVVLDDNRQVLGRRYSPELSGAVEMEFLLPITTATITVCIVHKSEATTTGRLYSHNLPAYHTTNYFWRAANFMQKVAYQLPYLYAPARKDNISYNFYSFVPEVIPFPDGSRRATGRTLRTPYMVDVDTRIVMCSTQMAKAQTVPARVFWLCHEVFGHLIHDCDGTAQGEIQADAVALQYYRQMGFGDSEAYLAVNGLIEQLERILRREPSRTGELAQNIADLTTRRDIIAANHGITIK